MEAAHNRNGSMCMGAQVARRRAHGEHVSTSLTHGGRTAKWTHCKMDAYRYPPFLQRALGYRAWRTASLPWDGRTAREGRQQVHEHEEQEQELERAQWPMASLSPPPPCCCPWAASTIRFNI